MTQVEVIKKGDEFWCVHPRMPETAKGTIVALTELPAKNVGIEFPEEIIKKRGGDYFHDCDGQGKRGSCLWVRPRHLKTDEELDQLQRLTAEHVARPEPEFVEELHLAR